MHRMFAFQPFVKCSSLLTRSTQCATYAQLGRIVESAGGRGDVDDGQTRSSSWVSDLGGGARRLAKSARTRDVPHK